MPNYKVKTKQLYSFTTIHQIFQTKFSLVWCEDRERIERLLNCNLQNNVSRIGKNQASCFFMEMDEEIRPTVAFPFKWDNSPQLISLLSHECIHAVICMFRLKAIPLPKDLFFKETDEENFCYTHQWLFQEFLFALKEQDKYKISLGSETLIQK